MNAPFRVSVLQPQRHRFFSKTAFLLNHNARAVTPKLEARFRRALPAGDLFISKTLEDAQKAYATIMKRGYGRVVVGGGDGTLMNAITGIDKLCNEIGYERPVMGALKLGTGNALSSMLGATDPLKDAIAASEGSVKNERLQLLRTDDGTLTTFAGVGWDGDVINDYKALKKHSTNGLTRALLETQWGYLGAVAFKTIPNFLKKGTTHVRVTSKSTAYRMVYDAETKTDVEVPVPAGTVLFEGKAPMATLGSIPFFGFDFKMFPFAQRKKGYVQLRVGDAPLLTVLANLFPKVWKGTFRHKDLCDVLVKDVVIEGEREMAYQVGGDAAGMRSKVSFTVAEGDWEITSFK